MTWFTNGWMDDLVYLWIDDDFVYEWMRAQWTSRYMDGLMDGLINALEYIQKVNEITSIIKAFL